MATRRFGTGVKGKRKNFGSSQNKPEFRRPKAAFRGAEAASQNFEKAFPVCHYSGRALLLPFVPLHFISFQMARKWRRMTAFPILFLIL
jgi:hypothetical protein